MEEEKKDGYNIFDLRLMRPIAVKDKKNQMVYTLQQSQSFEIENKKIYFYKPNNISLFVNIAHRELKEAKKLYNEFVKIKLKENSPVEFKEEENSKLYDYFERIQLAVISIYTAIEALANVAIPRDFELEKINNKKVKEIWTKDNIERWLTTSEKLGDIVPEILKIESPKKIKLWAFFKKLEEIRNDIIHQKSTDDPNKVDTLFLRKLLKSDVFKITESGFAIIQYFCEKDKTHSFFPFGFGDVQIKPVELENFESHFELIEDNKEEK